MLRMLQVWPSFLAGRGVVNRDCVFCMEFAALSYLFRSADYCVVSLQEDITLMSEF